MYSLMCNVRLCGYYSQSAVALLRIHYARRASDHSNIAFIRGQSKFTLTPSDWTPSDYALPLASMTF
jgi:hypothetical protein